MRAAELKPIVPTLKSIIVLAERGKKLHSKLQVGGFSSVKTELYKGLGGVRGVENPYSYERKPSESLLTGCTPGLHAREKEDYASQKSCGCKGKRLLQVIDNFYQHLAYLQSPGASDGEDAGSAAVENWKRKVYATQKAVCIEEKNNKKSTQA
eukprot:scaffold203636_cov21-Tisochrysis_lutea.AAC.1